MTTTSSKIEWNAETEQWEVNGQKFEGEILWCNGRHDGLNIHDPWWCIWKTEQELES